MKLLTLFVRYGDSDYQGAFKRLCQLYQRIEGLDYDAVLIDTALPVDMQVKLGPKILMIGGNNTRREFSGWNTALERFPDLLDGYDLVHIVTSAFENEYNGFYPYIERRMLLYAARHPEVALAHVDAYPDAVRLFGRSFQTWGCSKFILAAPERIRRLATFVGDFSIDDFFAKSASMPFRPNAPLSQNYQQHLLNWLTGEGLPHGQWHSVFELSSANLQRFHAKAMSIIDEHSLSMRLRETGARIVDYTWLHSRGIAASASQIPDEVTQVKQRNLFLFSNPIIESHLDLMDRPESNSFQQLFHVTGDAPFSRTAVVEALWTGNRELQKYLDPDRPLHSAAIHLNQDMAIDGEQREWLAQPDDEITQDSILPFTRGMHAIWLARDDLRTSFDVNEPDGRRAMNRWWIQEGMHDARYAGFVDAGAYSEIDALTTHDIPLPITRGLHAVCDAREDMRTAIDLAAAAGREALLSWWVRTGMHEPELRGFMSDDIYAQPSPTVEQDQPLPVTRGLHAVRDARDDMHTTMDLSGEAGRRSLLKWWLQTGMQQPALSGFMPAGIYAQPSPSVEQDQALPITRGMQAVCLSREDMRAAIDLSTVEGRRKAIAWWVLTGMHQPELQGFMPVDAYAQTSPAVEQDHALPITCGLVALLTTREDLAKLDLGTREGRRQLICWWVNEGRLDTRLAGFMQNEIYMQPDATLTQDASLPITRGMHAIWLSRDDLRDVMDIATPEGRQALADWWMREALYRPDFDCFVHASVYGDLAAGVEQDTFLPITRGMHALRNSRSDLLEFADLRTPQGRASLVGWWLMEGAHDSLLSRLIPEHIYTDIDPALPQDAGIPINRAMCAFYVTRPDALDNDRELGTPEARKALVKWWVEQLAYGTLRLPFRMTETMLSLDESGWMVTPDVVHPLALALYQAREDLRNAFDIGTPDGRKALNVWLHTYGRNEMSVKIYGSVEADDSGAEDASVKGGWREGGVNIVGFPRGELGIGEDVRMASLAMTTVDCDQCVPRISLRIGARQSDLALRNYEVNMPQYKTNLIFLPHYETIRLLGASGDSILGGRYNIGCWQWELPRYPKGLELALVVVDEIWSSTTFTAEAMRSVTDKPVLVMPMAVHLPELTRAYVRPEFDLPDNRFVFLNVLDGNSSVYRKNPLAVVQAFQKAFPRAVEGVHLLLKTMNMGTPSAQWDKVLLLCEGDPRISIISGALPREKVIALQSLADCFVSLHRAEGFGRNIAEAMLLGKPVIASNFSGNTDFTNDTTAFMVDGETIPVLPEQYSFGAGQSWFDADVDSAAAMMQRCFQDKPERDARAAAGQAFVRSRYAPESVGRRYLERLQTLKLVR
ncbi:glycosyltransferase [Paraburkholderia sp. PREW-6R]|uniref:glycosyltransferase family 4 protein n=1 Tax=Paraburkholderia sp. PREW-6R TaxID=3141544 RepID=UPI0031F53636